MRQYLTVLIGCIIQAFAISCILKPNDLVVAGITGWAIVLEHWIHIPYTYIYYVTVLCILLSAYLVLGKRAAKRIVFLSLTYPLLLIVANALSFNFIDEGTEKIVICIFYGVFMGFGTGLVLKEGFSQGSSDTLAKVIHKLWGHGLTLPQMMLAIDVFILLISLTVFSKVTVLYALIIQFTYSKVISFVLFGGNMRIVKMVIISKNVEAIKQLLDDELEVGYSLDYVVNKKGEVMERIISVLPFRDAAQTRERAQQVDPNVFINFVPTLEAWGKDSFLQKREGAVG